MHSTLVLVTKIALLVLLWVFIFIVIRTLSKQTTQAAGVRTHARKNSSAPVGLPATPAQKNPQTITITSGPLTGSQLNMNGYTDITIGRAPTSTLVIEDDYASGTNSRIFVSGTQWFVEDQDSRNGTFLEGQRLDQPEHIKPGDIIRVGQTELRIN